MKNSLKNDPVRQVLREQLRLNAEFCTECGLCVKECGFLQKYGSPKRVADAYEPSNVAQQAMSFECSLCGLCSAVCPQKLDPAKLFLEMRRDVAMRGKTFLRGHSVLLNYEKRGTSRRYTWYGLPAGCDTVFFPGCALPGTRPDSVHHLFQLLQKSFPSLGMVLDCCSKPSHDLGREEHFHTMFGEMTQYLLQQGVKQVLVACPNCYQIFTEHGKGLKITTAYES